jgi:hypothetical protein
MRWLYTKKLDGVRGVMTSPKKLIASGGNFCILLAPIGE